MPEKTKLISNFEEIRDLLYQMNKTDDALGKDGGEIIRSKLSEIRIGVVHQEQIDWKRAFQQIGGFYLGYLRALNEFNERQFVELLLCKHDKYGAAPLLEWREVGIIIRISSKIARIENLMSGQAEPTLDESLKDTIVDVLGYCVLGLALVDEGARHV